MLFLVRSSLITLVLLALTQQAFAQMVGINLERDKGVYELGTPERGKTKQFVEFGQMGNKQVMAAAACQQGCPAAVYGYQKELSATLKRAVFFNRMGLYVIRYDADSFIVVQPDAELGRKVWKNILHANIYSKNANTAKSVKRDEIVAFAKKLSNDIMNQETGEMAHGAGTYYLAVPQKHSGTPSSEYQIRFENGGHKSLVVKPCEKCSEDRYDILPEATAAAGVDVYQHSGSYYVFDIGDGVLVYTFANARGLGKRLWTKHSTYNVWSNNRAYIRQLLNSPAKQQAIDKAMATYFADVKQARDARLEAEQAAKTANRELPAEGMKNSTQQKQAFVAAKDWAKSWNWKETLKSAYFVSRDWKPAHNALTGLVVARNITGVVTMTHPDGRCRFQYMTFRQDYDGRDFVNLHATGVGPIYDIPCDKL